MKLKSVAWIGFIIAAFFIVTALFINFDLVPNINNFTESSRNLMNELSSQSSEIRISLSALNVAAHQHETLFLSVLNDQRIVINDASLQLNESLLMLNALLIDINRISIGRHSALINIMLSNIQSLASHNEQLRNTLVQDNVNNELLQQLTFTIQFNINMIEANSSVLNNRIIQDMTMILNFTVIVLILIVGILLIGVFHLVSHLLPNIIKSLKTLSGSDILNESIPNIKPYYSEAQTIKDEINAIYDEKKFIVELQNKLMNVFVVEDTMNVLFDFLKSRLSIDRVGLAYVDYQSQTFIAEYGVLHNQETLLGAGFSQKFSDSSLFAILSHQQPIINNDLPASLKQKPKSAALTMLYEEQIKSNLTIPIIMNNTVFGFIFLSSYETNFFNHSHIDIGKRVSNEVKTLLHRAYFTNVILTKMTSAFSEIVENKDSDTGNHILRVVKYSTIIARALRERKLANYPIDEKTILEIERYAAVHDIGKVGIPDHILKKDSKLSDDEWAIMKKHPVIGGDVFKNLRLALDSFDSHLYETAENITRYHHERWDGLGYPYGLKGNEIPLVARIVAIADVFDALSTQRSYKHAFTFDEAVQIIIDLANTQLDPILVDTFVSRVDAIKESYSKLNPTRLNPSC